MQIAGVVISAVVLLAIIGLGIFFVKVLMKTGEGRKDFVDPLKKRQPIFTVILLLIAVFILLRFVGGSFLNPFDNGFLIFPDQIEYRVSGTARNIGVRYSNSSGIKERVETQIPFSKTFNFKPGFPVYLFVYNMRDSGTVVCEIVNNGKIWKSAMTSAANGECKVEGISGENR